MMPAISKVYFIFPRAGHFEEESRATVPPKFSLYIALYIGHAASQCRRADCLHGERQAIKMNNSRERDILAREVEGNATRKTRCAIRQLGRAF